LDFAGFSMAEAVMFTAVQRLRLQRSGDAHLVAHPDLAQRPVSRFQAQFGLSRFLSRSSLDEMKFLGLIILGLFLICGCQRGVKHGVEFVLVVGTNHPAEISSNETARVVKVLARRMDKLGYPSEVKAKGENLVSVKLPFAAVESMSKRRTLLTKSGALEVRLVHEENARLLREGIVPGDHRLMHLAQLGTSGRTEPVSFIVSKEPVPGVSGANIARAAMVRGPINDAQVAFELNDAGRVAFAKVTGENIGRQLAIVFDGELCSAPKIQTPITEGRGIISGGSMTDQEVRELALLLESPLHVPLQVVEERTF
jgi:protein-export membrane protein SecD